MVQEETALTVLALHVLFSNVIVKSNDGDIVMMANRSNSSGDTNRGCSIVAGTAVTAIGTGSVSITAIGGTGGINNNFGLEISNAAITANGGGITLDGTAGDGTGLYNQGVLINGGVMVEDQSIGQITIIGQGGSGSDLNRGVEFREVE